MDTVTRLRQRGSAFLEVDSGDLYDKNKVSDVYTVYFSRTATSCKLIYYDWQGGRWHKRLREISFTSKKIDPTHCVCVFNRIAKKCGEEIGTEPNKKYSNGINSYFLGAYQGMVTVLDMNSAYLYALTQPLADWTTRTEATIDDVIHERYDYFSFENDLHCEIFYKKDFDNMMGAAIWADVKIYGYRGKVFFEKTAAELYRLKREKDTEVYKNVANIYVGCLHKRSGKRNNTTMAASLYAWFAWRIDEYVSSFYERGYEVLAVTTDAIKIKGKYNVEDGIVTLGDGLGEFKVEYEGIAKYFSEGHYEEKSVKWKGKPAYLRDGYKKCLFVENLEEEKKIYEKYSEK